MALETVTGTSIFGTTTYSFPRSAQGMDGTIRLLDFRAVKVVRGRITCTPMCPGTMADAPTDCAIIKGILADTRTYFVKSTSSIELAFANFGESMKKPGSLECDARASSEIQASDAAA